VGGSGSLSCKRHGAALARSGETGRGFDTLDLKEAKALLDELA
jgi:hypothetical protein